MKKVGSQSRTSSGRSGGETAYRVRGSTERASVACIGAYSGERSTALRRVVRAGADGLADLGLRLRERREHPRQVGLADQHLAGLRALVARDHAAALHHVDQ